MRTRNYGRLAAMAAASAAACSSFANLTIAATMDSSVTGHAQSAAIQNVINAAIGTFQSTYGDNFTAKIQFKVMTSGLGASSTWIGTTTFASYLTALTADQSSASDATALSTIGAGPNEPVTNHSGIKLSTANAHAVGLNFGATPDGFDGTVSINVGLCDLDRSNGIDAGKYDMYAVVCHEIDEVLGSSSWLGSSGSNNGFIKPIDLWRYNSSGGRSFSTGASAAYFSLDGTTLLARFNQVGGADYADWAQTSLSGDPAQVQDAFGTPGTVVNYGANERTMMDVIGYNVVPEPAAFAVLGLGLAALLRRRRTARP